MVVRFCLAFVLGAIFASLLSAYWSPVGSNIPESQKFLIRSFELLDARSSRIEEEKRSRGEQVLAYKRSIERLEGREGSYDEKLRMTAQMLSEAVDLNHYGATQATDVRCVFSAANTYMQSDPQALNVASALEHGVQTCITQDRSSQFDWISRSNRVARSPLPKAVLLQQVQTESLILVRFAWDYCEQQVRAARQSQSDSHKQIKSQAASMVECLEPTLGE